MDPMIIIIEDGTWMLLLDAIAVGRLPGGFVFGDARPNESVQEILYVPGFESIVENSVAAAQF